MERLVNDWQEDENGDYDEYLKKCRKLWKDKFMYDRSRRYGHEFTPNNYKDFLSESARNGWVVYIQLLLKKPLRLEEYYADDFIRGTIDLENVVGLKALIDNGIRIHTKVCLYVKRDTKEEIINLLADNMEPPVGPSRDIGAVRSCRNPKLIIRYMERFPSAITAENLYELLSDKNYIAYAYIVDNLMNDSTRKEVALRWRNRNVDYRPINELGWYLLTGEGDPKKLLMDSINNRTDQAVYVIIQRGGVQLTEWMLEVTRNLPFTSELLKADV